MKITFGEKTSKKHVNPSLHFGRFYKILRRKDGIPMNSGEGVVFQVAKDSITYFYSDSSCTHSDKDYAGSIYEFEEYTGTITIECP